MDPSLNLRRNLQLLPLAGLSLSLSSLPLLADSPVSLRIDHDNSAVWQGKENYVFFLQWSSDLVSWEYVPKIYTGEGNFSWQFNSSISQLYCRVQAVFAPGVDPNSQDFDDDGISNLTELTYRINGQSAQLDPLNADSDGDGISDGVEISLGTNPAEVDHASEWTSAITLILTPTKVAP